MGTTLVNQCEEYADPAVVPVDRGGGGGGGGGRRGGGGEGGERGETPTLATI